jgi:hypothetical protein
MLLAMVYYAILDHSRFIREIGCTAEMIIFVVGFVLSTVLIIGFHCAMIAFL